MKSDEFYVIDFEGITLRTELCSQLLLVGPEILLDVLNLSEDLVTVLRVFAAPVWRFFLKQMSVFVLIFACD